jgi:hypothetical protein
MYKVLILFILNTIGNTYADCIFKITNNFYQDIPIKVGFYGYESKTINAEKTNTSLVILKSKQFNCLSQSNNGLGLSYGEISELNAKGKWVYQPYNNMIVAIGINDASLKSDNYVYGMLGNKQSIVLMNNYKLSTDYFNIVINPIININYRTGSYY